MEILEKGITVSTAEISTTVDRAKIEGKISELLRRRGILIDISDMRSPITIAESMGLLSIDNEV